MLLAFITCGWAALSWSSQKEEQGWYKQEC